MLSDLIPMIEGKWWLIGGGMLGLCRDNDLIDYDNDLDIMILPDTKINIPKNSNYRLQNYYMDSKFYDINLPKYKPNLWNEYLRYFSKNKKLNRAELYREASKSYKQERIIAEFSEPYIDIYVMRKTNFGYEIPYFEHEFFYDLEVDTPVKNTDLGFSVNLPSNTESVCRRIYGDDWNIPKEDAWKKAKSKFNI